MEQLNRIEIRGNVGSIKLQAVGDKHVAHLTVATNFVYKGRDGEPVMETTWHNITAWESKYNCDMHDINKGDKVYISGRLRSQRYIGNDGVERTSYEVIAQRLQLLDIDDSLLYES